MQQRQRVRRSRQRPMDTETPIPIGSAFSGHHCMRFGTNLCLDDNRSEIESGCTKVRNVSQRGAPARERIRAVGVQEPQHWQPSRREGAVRTVVVILICTRIYANFRGADNDGDKLVP